MERHSDSKYKDSTHFIKLLRNLYGCKQATCNQWKQLSYGLTALGFKESKTDIFFCNDCLPIFYTDDCLIVVWDNSITDNIFQSLSDKFLLKDKGDISDFHGICITKDENRNMHMTQPGLKQAIITNLGLDNLTCKLTPADSALHTDTNGPA